eukprot:TRINITY_DN3433_c0_g2_i1.p1 TRINITY_DN3433_c0_g2~~TRINITY_DN3433_c0_g2_i1.p1  ORF type:complete len:245 (-),score=23.43 TRINITY_DN3433_c0_g2_i1:1146-1880(-)
MLSLSSFIVVAVCYGSFATVVPYVDSCPCSASGSVTLARCDNAATQQVDPTCSVTSAGCLRLPTDTCLRLSVSSQDDGNVDTFVILHATSGTTSVRATQYDPLVTSGCFGLTSSISDMSLCGDCDPVFPQLPNTLARQMPPDGCSSSGSKKGLLGLLGLLALIPLMCSCIFAICWVCVRRRQMEGDAVNLGPADACPVPIAMPMPPSVVLSPPAAPPPPCDVALCMTDGCPAQSACVPCVPPLG